MILHIARRSEFDSARAGGSYAPTSLAEEGFIHCSTIAQITDTANRHFRGQGGLAVLCIDESRLKAELKYEPPMPAVNLDENENPGGLFPHIYGALNLDAVVGVIDLPCSADGTFELPAALAKLRR